MFVFKELAELYYKIQLIYNENCRQGASIYFLIFYGANLKYCTTAASALYSGLNLDLYASSYIVGGDICNF